MVCTHTASRISKFLMTTWVHLSVPLVMCTMGETKTLCRHIPVYRLVVTFVRHHLGRKVVRGTAQRPRLVRNPLRKAKVCYFEVAVTVEQQVLWFKITVDDMFLMQVLERQGDFGGIEFGNRVGEALMSRVSVESVPSLYIIP
jgi:hypothetical protein